MGDHDRFDLGRCQALARHVHDVVGAAQDEPLPVLVDQGEVAVAPQAGEGRPVRLEIAGLVPPHPARHRRPGLTAHQLADLTAHRLCPVVHHVDVHAQRRAAQRAAADGLDRVRREEGSADLGAAREIDDRDPPPEDVPGQPFVGVGVPWLTRRAEHAHRRQIEVVQRDLLAGAQRADQRRRDPEHGDAVPVHQVPQAVGVGHVGRALVEQQRRAVGVRPEDR